MKKLKFVLSIAVNVVFNLLQLYHLCLFIHLIHIPIFLILNTIGFPFIIELNPSGGFITPVWFKVSWQFSCLMVRRLNSC